MSQFIPIHFYRFTNRRFWLACLLLFLLPGCASQFVAHTTPPPLIDAGPAVVIADVDVLEVTPRMHRFLESYVLDYESANTRRQLLSLALVDRSMLGFHYNESHTLTAKEAFNTRSGNCIGFANLFIAMAREAGLNAQYHEVVIAPEWRSQQDTLLVAKHINVVVSTARGPYQVDISGREINSGSKRKILKDHEAKALYFNNLAAEALIDGDLPTAHAYLLKAIETAPRLPDAWSNLGVVLARNEQLNDAELAYRTALRIDHTDRTAMANLYELYMALGKTSEAIVLKNKVDRYRKENPYYLLALSEEAIEQEQFDESMDLLTRAIEKKDNEHLLHFAMARTQYLSGQKVEARSSLDRARELAPEEVQQDYNRPLHELVQVTDSASLQ